MKNLFSLITIIVISSCAAKNITTQTTTPEPNKPAADSAVTPTNPTPQLASKTKASSTTNCKLENDLRQIEIYPEEPGCIVRYTKFGQANDVASAKNQIQFCKDVFDRIKSHLEAGTFVCE